MLSDMNNIVLEFNAVNKDYLQSPNTMEVLQNVSFSIQQAQIVAIIGSSGSGKSTLLHIAGLLDNPSSGGIKILGDDVAMLSQSQKNRFRLTKLGFIYQYHHLLADFTALENILMPQLIARANLDQALLRAKSMMANFGIADKQHSFPGQLSGGQQQRVAIARAMINKPQIILADEPTGNLDSANAEQVFKLMQEVVQCYGVTVLLATHSMELATNSDVIFELKNKNIIQLK